jgi:aspartyl-tRNA(Asn)/glutamyl-tRNA(Gln) amidotransferase subunit C
MQVDREATLKAARLARLKLSVAELDRLSADLGAIVGYVEQLGEVDTDGVEPLAHCLPLQNAFREDAGTPSLPADAALGNAPKRAGDFYSVPPILEN